MGRRPGPRKEGKTYKSIEHELLQHRLSLDKGSFPGVPRKEKDQGTGNHWFQKKVSGKARKAPSKKSRTTHRYPRLLHTPAMRCPAARPCQLLQDASFLSSGKTHDLGDLDSISERGIHDQRDSSIDSRSISSKRSQAQQSRDQIVFRNFPESPDQEQLTDKRCSGRKNDLKGEEDGSLHHRSSRSSKTLPSNAVAKQLTFARFSTSPKCETA